jgi:hypothetical protein
MPAANLEDADKLLSPEEASEYLRQKHGIKRAPRTLQVMRREGRGPAFRRYGNEVRYTTPAIDVWVGETFAEEFRNTSEEAARRLITCR